MTHSHQSCGRGAGGRVLADLRCPATDVQTPPRISWQSSHLAEESNTETSLKLQPVVWTSSAQARGGASWSSYLPGHQLQSVLLERLHLVQPGHDDLLQLLEAVRLERHPGQTLQNRANNYLLPNEVSASAAERNHWNLQHVCKNTDAVCFHLLDVTKSEWIGLDVLHKKTLLLRSHGGFLFGSFTVCFLFGSCCWTVREMTVKRFQH